MPANTSAAAPNIAGVSSSSRMSALADAVIKGCT
jgi:hypothetical protein